MKLFAMVLLSLFLQGRCASLAKLESRENQTEVDQQRSARVHRIANYEIPKKDDSRVEKFIRDIVSKQTALITTPELLAPLNNFPNLNKLVQQEARLFLELNVILGELVRDGTATLKNIDLAISETIDGATSSTSDKPVSTGDNDLRNLFDSLQNLDNYLRDTRNSQDGSNSSPSPSRIESMNELEVKAVKNIARSLDNVLTKIQNHISFVRSVFDKLCRKHHPAVSVQTNTSDPEKFELMSEPKEASIP